MTGYHMSPAYEGWRYMKTAEILSAVRATCADAIHIDVPSVWPEGKERYGINSQQGSREFFKLLRNTLDNNGLSNVAVATEGSPGEGYMKYVDMAQLVRGYTTTSMLDGITAETMIELQVGSDYEKAGEARNSIPGGKSKIDKKEKKNFRFDKSAVGGRLAAMRSLGEPNIDAVIIAPFVRAYPHLGAATPLMGGYEKDPAAALHNLAAQALHTWATIQRDAPFNSSPTIQLFMDCPPWDSLEIIKAARKEAVKSGKRLEGRILNTFAYGEYALVRWWAVNQPRMAPPAEWSRGDAARYKLTDGKTLTARRSSPLCLTLAVDGQTLADIDIFEGWKNNAGLLRDYGPAFLADQVDGIGRGEK
jgi:hypothetical protein